MHEQYTFKQFIQDEIDKRGSQQEFAEQIGVSQSTISRWLNPKKKAEPDLKTLVKLSEVTGKSLEALVGLAYPDVSDKTQPSPSARLIAQSFEKLPEHIQRAIITLVRSGND